MGCYWLQHLIIIPRIRVGYELLDSGRGAKHQFGCHELISNKRELINCFIKYQIYGCILLLTVSKAELRGRFPYLGKLEKGREPFGLPETQYPVFGI